MDEKITFSRIEDAIEDFRKGKMVIVVDDEDRENEGDFITPAELITPEKVNFMLREGRGVLCSPITMSRAKELNLDHQVDNNTSVLGTPFTITVDKLEGCTTGVSAHDRAETIAPATRPNQVVTTRTQTQTTDTAVRTGDNAPTGLMVVALMMGAAAFICYKRRDDDQ